MAREGQVSKFTKGLNRDVHPLDSQEGFYEDAQDACILSRSGDFFELNNERGNIIAASVNSTAAPASGNYLVIGKVVIENYIILFSVNEAGNKSEIGIFDCNINTYETYVNNGLGQTIVRSAAGPVYTTYADTTNLDFSLDAPIKGVARKLFNNNTIVYFTDNVRPVRALNLDNLPLADIGDNSELLTSQQIPVIDYVETLESGNIEVGTYQFVARYLNENFDPIYFGIVSNPIPVVENLRSEGRNKYDGNIPGTNAPKSIVLEVKNLDNNYRYIELIAISFPGAGDTANAVVYQRKPIIGETVTFVYSDKDTFISTISLDEISLIKPNYITAKAIAQKDGHLLLSNLTSNSISDLQGIANKIRLKYKIQNIPYTDVVEGTGVNVINPNMQLISVYRIIDLDGNNNIIPNNDIYFLFNKPVDPVSVNVNNFALVEHEFVPGGPNFLETINYPVAISAASDTVKCTFAFPTTSLNMSDFSDLATTTVYTYAIGTLIGDAPYIWAGDNGLAADIAEQGNLGNTTTALGQIITYAGVADITTPPLEFNLALAFPTPLIAGNIVEIYGVTYTDAREVLGGGPLVYQIGGPDLGPEVGVGIQGFLSPDIDDFNQDNTVPNTNNLNNSGYFGDYVDEGVCFELKTYMREEVYSFGIQAIYTNGGKSPVLHIPGNDRNTLVTTSAAVEDDGISGYLGTYVSSSLYPPDGGYPAALGIGTNFSAGGFVRHHKMPTQSQQPIVSFEDNSYQIRIIKINPVWGEDFLNVLNGTNINFDSTTDIDIGTTVIINGIYERTIVNKVGVGPFTYTINAVVPVAITSASWEKTIKALLQAFPSVYSTLQGFSFCRQRRDTIQNRSIVMQGIAQKLLRHFGGYAGGPYICNTYLFGKTRIQPSTRVYPAHDPKAAFGYPANSIDFLSSFYSPDSILLKREIPTASFIKPVSEIRAPIFATAKVLFAGEKRRSGGYHAFGNYNTYLSLGNLVVTPQQILRTRFLPSNYDTYYGNQGTQLPDYPALPKVINYINEGYQLLDFGPLGALQDTAPAGPEIDITLAASGGNNNIDEYQNIGSSTGFVSARYLYNIYNNNAQQYGDVSDSEYSIAHTVYDLSLSGNIEFASGDIFISKFSCKNSNNWRWGLNYQLNGDKRALMVNARTSQPSNEEGEELRALMYFFVESEVNCNYRHRPVQLDNNGVPVGFGVPYYPNNPIITDGIINLNTGTFQFFKSNGTGVLDIAPTLGESDGYNPAYSRDAVIDSQSSLPFGFEEVTQFKNRTIYSQKSFEGEQSDRYRFFLPNDFHDIPKHSGEINDTFVFNGTFWIHTSKSLWRSFMNESTAIASSSGEVYLGNGGLFPRPSIEVFTTHGGYAGTQSRFAGTNTPFGRFFIDYDQRRLFLLKGESVEELQGNLSRWLSENIPFSTVHEDNPFDPNSDGYLSEYDYKTNRFFITKNSRQDPSWTLSWAPQVGNYVSFHSYKPNVYISNGDRFFTVNNNPNIGGYKLWEHNKGNYGQFYDLLGLNPGDLGYENTVFDMYVTYFINKDPLNSKSFDNLFTKTISLNEATGGYNHRDFFYNIRAWNEHCNTGDIPLIINNPQQYSDNLRLDGDEIRFAMPRDRVQNAYDNVLSPGNLFPIGTKYLPRIKGKWARVKLDYKNDKGYRFALNNILSLYRRISG